MTHTSDMYDGKTLAEIKKAQEEAEKKGENWDVYMEYTDNCSDDTVMATTDIVNPENTQKLIYNVLIPQDDIPYESSKMVLLITSRYHNWRSDASDILDAIDGRDNAELQEFLTLSPYVKQYNDAVAAFNEYGDAETIESCITTEEIEKIIESNSNQI